MGFGVPQAPSSGPCAPRRRAPPAWPLGTPGTPPPRAPGIRAASSAHQDAAWSLSLRAPCPPGSGSGDEHSPSVDHNQHITREAVGNTGARWVRISV